MKEPLLRIPPSALNSLDDGRAMEWRAPLWDAINARYPDDARIISNVRMDFVSAVEAAVQTAMRVAIEESRKGPDALQIAVRVLRETAYPLTGETAAQLVETYAADFVRLQPDEASVRSSADEDGMREMRARWDMENAAARAALDAWDRAAGPALTRMREAIKAAQRVHPAREEAGGIG